jgi:nucleotide-binding universal stress UspA family protein
VRSEVVWRGVVHVGATPVVVVGYKNSAAGRHALETAIGLAGPLGAVVHVVHVVELGDYPVDPDSEDWEEWGRMNLELIGEQVSTYIRDLPGATFSVERGDPARVLHEMADEEGTVMIVVGLPTKGVGPLARLFTHPVSTSVTKHVHTPVLLVPLPDAQSTARS